MVNNFIDILDFTPKKKKRIKQKNEIIFWGEDNCLPDDIFSLYDKSPTNQGIINRKHNLAKGSKVSFTNTAAQEFSRRIGFKDLWSKTLLDYLVYGCFSLQITKGFPNEVLSIIYQDVTQIRFGKFEQGDRIVVNESWDSTARYEKDKIFSIFDKELEFSGDNSEDWISFLFHKRESLGNVYYTVPSWWSGKTSIETEINLIEYSANLLNNSFTPTGILNLPSTVSPEEIKILKKQIKEEMTGIENAGKILVIPSDGEKAITFTPLSQNIDSTQISNYLSLVRQNIIISHTLPSPTIIGLPGGASLGGDGGTIDVSNRIFFETDILGIQNELKEIFENLFKMAGYETQIIFDNPLVPKEKTEI